MCASMSSISLHCTEHCLAFNEPSDIMSMTVHMHSVTHPFKGQVFSARRSSQSWDGYVDACCG